MEPRSWCLVYEPEIYLIKKSSKLATKRFHKITKKKLDFCRYFNFLSLLFASVNAEDFTG